jgi:cation:H+ antiporter
MFLDLILLATLFIALGIFADVLVRHVRHVAHTLKLRLFVIGIILGAFTTMPDFAVGLNAIPQGIVSLSAGNLLGGIMVIFGLVLGISIILHRSILTDGGWRTLVPTVTFILSPLVLAVDGVIDMYDGVILLILTGILIYYFHRTERRMLPADAKHQHQGSVPVSVLWVLGSIGGILLASYIIVDTSVRVLEHLGVSQFILGALVFSIGTNLPEFTIAITSWWRKVPDLSISHLVSSALMNVTALGILAIIAGSITVTAGYGYLVLSTSMVIVLLLFMLFYRTGYALSRAEGLYLVGVYCFFVVGILLTH